MVEENRKIVLNHSEIFLRSDGIVQINVFNNTDFEAKECAEVTGAYDQLLEPKKYPLLHIVGEYVAFSKSAREYSASDEGLKYSKAEAYVITSLSHKILANFYLKINQPSVPTKFFGTEKEAVEWLGNYR